ncbi:MAG: SufD family Fe-S cluster assembly protein [Desulfurococcales archaeon]|nr:SufD family Fe-S cluster assembly protein [Desulfurococcales archaeon]
MAGTVSTYKDIEEIPFQEIADSPTLKYYTNWKVFQQRLKAPDSKEYIAEPSWIARLKERVTDYLILGKDVEQEVSKVRLSDVASNEDILAEIGATGKMDYIHVQRLTKGVKVALPDEEESTLLIVSLGGDGYTGHHVSLEVGKGANLELILVDLGGIGNASLKTFTLSGRLCENAQVRVTSLSSHGETAVYTKRVYRLSSHAKLEVRSLYIGGPSTRVNEDAYLEGIGSSVAVQASALSTGSSWIDVLLNAIHEGERSKSLVTARGASLDNAFLSLRGIAIVKDQAEWSRSHVDVHSLILSDTARANASPMLEIHTGNVEEAYHSASVHSIEESELFYLATRGLSRNDAIKLLLDGVAGYSGVLELLGISLEGLMGQ